MPGASERFLFTGELLHELTIAPTRDCQPTGAPKGPTRPPTPK
jgi:hypothetical protein